MNLRFDWILRVFAEGLSKVKLKFLNANLLVRFDILACADNTAGPLHFNRFDKGIVIYPEDGSEFAL